MMQNIVAPIGEGRSLSGYHISALQVFFGNFLYGYISMRFVKFCTSDCSFVFWRIISFPVTLLYPLPENPPTTLLSQYWKLFLKLFPQNLASGNFLQSKYVRLLFPLSVESVTATVSHNFNLRYTHICRLVYSLGITCKTIFQCAEQFSERSFQSFTWFSCFFPPFRSWKLSEHCFWRFTELSKCFKYSLALLSTVLKVHSYLHI